MRKIFLTIAIAALAALLLIAGRMYFRQASSFNEAEACYARHDWKLAIRQYDTALHFYVPFSPVSEKAASRLWQIGQMFEAQGRPDWALIAYSSIRSSFYGTRSFFLPGKPWIEKCDNKIAFLDTRNLIRHGGIKPGDEALQLRKYMAVFRDDRAPSVFWSILAELGLFGWAGSAVATALLGFEKTGRLKRRQFMYGAAGFLLCVVVWGVSLLMA